MFTLYKGKVPETSNEKVAFFMSMTVYVHILLKGLIRRDAIRLMLLTWFCPTIFFYYKLDETQI